ncbi:DUF4384 domain-containing protein [Meiothermus granaticius]|uniref:Uncharacterized protein n=1 Tax=Meiothermus granaticius NBRC 107808 TaxID=1227551 RepID=A0A399F592_9DEIN|nr:DUF4384 domain-containing protein [Meiothermus granaticius]RIH91388.1 hypothetical protein Mgrana_02731 [Meiothermus granaticius NBRC 107808]
MRFLSGLVLAVVLGACAPQMSNGIGESQRSAWGVQPVIRDFAPDRGAGASYKVRERVFFNFSLSQAGYVTLITIDPDTTTVVLERNLPLAAGAHTLPLKSDKTAQGQATYLVLPPTGVSRFRLLFTDTPVEGSGFFQGKLSEEELNRQTGAYLEASRVRDVAETTLRTVAP